MEFYRGIGVIAGELYQEMFVVKNFQCFASIQSFSCVLRAHSAPLFSQEHSSMYIFQHDFVHTALQVSEPSCFISSAQQIGSMGKPRSWHTLQWFLPTQPWARCVQAAGCEMVLQLVSL